MALYPDALLSQVLMASTYPADVPSAAQWSKSAPNLSGDAATKAVDGQSWDPSVKSLVAFPSVMDLMGREPQWARVRIRIPYACSVPRNVMRSGSACTSASPS